MQGGGDGVIWHERIRHRFEFKQILMATNQSKHDDLREFCKVLLLLSLHL